jgi:hypothetical protein
MIVAALYVHANGTYYGLPDVEPWDEKRDARLYAGPHPVVAHPPCSRWCRLAGLVQARYPHLKKGEDDGCFKAALSSVRTWGGVLEHPAYSDAWSAFGLPTPHPGGSWQRGIEGGWTCHIEQGRYGHLAKKATWLYAWDIEPPSLRWGQTPDSEITAMVSWCANHTKKFGHHRASKYGEYGVLRDRIGKKQAAATPVLFRDLLLEMARSVYARRRAA